MLWTKVVEAFCGRRRFGGALTLAAGVCGALWDSAAVCGAEVRYNQDIRPILAEHCVQCHGPDVENRKGKLRLDLEAEAKRKVIVPRRAEQSELIRRIVSKDPDEVMPPPGKGKPLTEKQVEALRRWVEAGAPYDGHWAFQPITKPAAPLLGAGDGGAAPDRLTEIDRFLLSALKARGLSFAPAVSRGAWIRRVTLDLIGLPPTWEEVQAYLADESGGAEARVVDRLLSSPRYGERWGRHWLDLARYADTHGGSAIGFTRFPFSYTYRDYVIRALNADLPYDRFIVEQIAADQLGLSENDSALAALGFLTVGMQYRNRHDVIDDQIDVIGRGLMGLTVACARCHDHKFDPIPTSDYYGFYAALAGSHTPEDLPVIGAPAGTDALREYEKELALRKIRAEDMARDQVEVMRSRLRMQVGMYLREVAKGLPEQDTSTGFLSYRTDDIRPIVYNRWRDYLAAMPDNDPVFGPWIRLSRLGGAGFRESSSNVLAGLKKENGDPAGWKELHKLSVDAPRWNPRVLETLERKSVGSMVEVADAYGSVFSDAHVAWLKSVQAATMEAADGGEIIPDEEARHLEINSAVMRQLRRHLYQAGTPTAVPDDVASHLLNRPVNDTLAGRRGAIHDLHLNSPGSPPRAMALAESPAQPVYHVLRRGNPLDRGAVATPRFLTALSGAAPAVFRDGRRRLDLARAVAAKENPLTRRVIVNWIWQQHFGQGLVRTPDDWGTRGTSPTHPELLDYLASAFEEDGWSLKKLHRRIVLSAAYRQGAVENAQARLADPDNQLLWRLPRRRLDLEAMRDSMLAASGELDVTTGGRPFDLQAEPAVPRRSVYGFINRDIVSTLSSTFDGANPSSCTARRPDTTVPQQTLFALNSGFIQDRAAAMAKRAIQGAGDAPAERVRALYQLAYARNPETAELEMALEYTRRAGAEDAAKVWTRLAHVLLAANEFVFVD